MYNHKQQDPLGPYTTGALTSMWIFMLCKMLTVAANIEDRGASLVLASIAGSIMCAGIINGQNKSNARSLQNTYKKNQNQQIAHLKNN